MRFTRPRSSRYFFGVVVAVCGSLAGTTASCASDDDRQSVDGGAAPDGQTPAPDAPLADSGSVGRDAGAFDATAPTIDCTSEPCATALTTVSSGDAQTFCALLRDGTVACWGANNAGQLGRGEEAGVGDSAIPKRVVGLTNVITIERTCAIDKGGATHCWGTGPFLSGDGGAITIERTPVKLPIPRARKVSVGDKVGCAVLDDGVQCWGNNENAQVAPFDGDNRWVFLPPSTIALSQPGTVRDVTVGKATFVVLEGGATTLSWGETPPVGRTTSLRPDGLPQPITIPGELTSIEVDSDNVCAAASGTGYCWGAGEPNRRYVDLSRALPIPIVTPEPIRQVSTMRQRQATVANSNESVALPDRWCAVGISGDVHCWGYNTSGQAGDGTKGHAYNAVRVKGLPAPAVQVKVAFDTTCALLTTGKIHCWGSSFYGQLGTGSLKVSSLTPQEVLLP